MVKKLLISLFLVLLAYPAPSYSADATESSKKALTIEPLEELIFGSFTTDNLGGSIILDPKTCRRSFTNNVTSLKNNDHQCAEYLIKGEPNEIVRIILPDDLELDASKNELSGTAAISSFKSYPEDIVTLDVNGEAKISVAGTLYITKGTTKIDFNGNFEVEVEYQ